MAETDEGSKTARPATAPGGGRRGPADGSVRANGIRLRYLAWPGPTPPRYPPVVLLHGVLQSAEGMANLAAHLARHGPVVVPDLRGRGGSDQPAAGYDPATMADDVAALVETLALDRPVVIGRLHGGLVGYHLAARRPDLVRGLVLGDTAPEVDPVRADRALGAVRGLPPRFDSLDDALAYYRDVLRLSEARARNDIPHDLVPEPDGGYRWRHNLAVVERIEAASLPRADWDVVAEVRCPTLLLRGQRGEVPRPMAEKFCDTIRGCQVQTVLGARHDVFLGPGCEQSFAAVDLFLLRLHEGGAGAARQVTANLPDGAGTADAPDSQLPLPGTESLALPEDPAAGSAAALVERVVRAVNSRDEAAVAALFAPDGRVRQYGGNGAVREGGLEAAREAFARVFAGDPGAALEARDVLASGDRAACVFALRGTASDAVLAPAFLRVRDGRLIELTTYTLHVPAEHIS